MIVCDECGDPNKPLFFNSNKDQYCEECYYNSPLYKPTELENDWGVKLGRKLAKFDAFLVFDYESFNYYKDASEQYATELNDIFKKLGIKEIVAVPDYDENHAIIGFKKPNRKIYKKKVTITS